VSVYPNRGFKKRATNIPTRKFSVNHTFDITRSVSLAQDASGDTRRLPVQAERNVIPYGILLIDIVQHVGHEILVVAGQRSNVPRENALVVGFDFPQLRPHAFVQSQFVRRRNVHGQGAHRATQIAAGRSGHRYTRRANVNGNGNGERQRKRKPNNVPHTAVWTPRATYVGRPNETTLWRDATTSEFRFCLVVDGRTYTGGGDTSGEKNRVLTTIEPRPGSRVSESVVLRRHGGREIFERVLFRLLS